jgi:hypothetical protein
MAVGRAWREAAHHSLHRGQATAAGLLHHADQAVRQGGHGAAAGIADDLDEWLATQPDSSGTGEAALTLQCQRAEAAVRVGDAAAITALTSGVTTATATADTLVGARLAVAAVHGQRIAGHTKAALGIFTHVWDQGDGPPKLSAGLWACDLHMCQGLRVERENVRRPVIPRLHVRLRTSWPAGSRMYLRGNPATCRAGPAVGSRDPGARWRGGHEPQGRARGP